MVEIAEQPAKGRKGKFTILLIIFVGLPVATGIGLRIILILTNCSWAKWEPYGDWEIAAMLWTLIYALYYFFKFEARSLFAERSGLILLFTVTCVTILTEIFLLIKPDWIISIMPTRFKFAPLWYRLIFIGLMLLTFTVMDKLRINSGKDVEIYRPVLWVIHLPCILGLIVLCVFCYFWVDMESTEAAAFLNGTVAFSLIFGNWVFSLIHSRLLQQLTSS